MKTRNKLKSINATPSKNPIVIRDRNSVSPDLIKKSIINR